LSEREQTIRLRITVLQQMLDETCAELERVRGPLIGADIGPVGVIWDGPDVAPLNGEGR